MYYGGDLRRCHESFYLLFAELIGFVSCILRMHDDTILSGLLHSFFLSVSGRLFTSPSSMISDFLLLRNSLARHLHSNSLISSHIKKRQLGHGANSYCHCVCDCESLLSSSVRGGCRRKWIGSAMMENFLFLEVEASVSEVCELDGSIASSCCCCT